MHETTIKDGVWTGLGEGRARPLKPNDGPAEGTVGGRSEPRDSWQLGPSRTDVFPSRWPGMSSVSGEMAEPGGQVGGRVPLPAITPPAELRGGATTAPLGREEAKALKERQREADAMRAAEIRATMDTDRRLAEERIRALQEDLRTEIFRIWEEVLLRRQKIMNELFEKWCKILTE